MNGSKKYLEEENAQLKASATKARAEHDKVVQKLTAERDALKQEIEHLKEQMLFELQQRQQDYIEQLEALQAELTTTQDELEKSRNEVKQVRSAMVDINNLRTVIQQLVEPVTLDMVTETYKTHFMVSASASAYVLNPVDEAMALPVTFLLPKSGLRMYRSNGRLADLTRAGASERLARDEGIQSLLPPGIKSQLHTSYVLRRGPSHYYELTTPRTANFVLVSCLVEESPELKKWQSEHRERVISSERSKEHDGFLTLHLVLPFPGENPHIRLMPGIDVDFTESDLDSCRQERALQLREDCYLEYMKFHFSMT